MADLKAAALAGKLGPHEDAKEIRCAEEKEWKRVPWYLAKLDEMLPIRREEYEWAHSAAGLFQTPCLELKQITMADFMPVDWPARWTECGGRFYENRMIAPVTGAVWQQIGNSARYPDGMDFPHAPFVLSGIGTLSVFRDECLALGVMTEQEIHEQQTHAPDYAERLAESNAAWAAMSPEKRESTLAALHALEAKLSVRIAEGKQRIAEQKAEDARLAPEREAARQRAAVEKNRAFCNVNEVRQRLPLLKVNYSAAVAAELLTLLTQAATGGHFQRYPKWLGEAYRFTGEILELLGEPQQAVEYYGCALQADPKAGVAKRMKALQAKLALLGTPPSDNLPA